MYVKRDGSYLLVEGKERYWIRNQTFYRPTSFPKKKAYKMAAILKSEHPEMKVSVE